MALIRHDRGRSDCPRRVFIALPAGDGKPFENHAAAMDRAELALHMAGWAMDTCRESGNCHVDDARNSLVYEFLKSDCSDLVFIDADVGWSGDELVRLMSFDRDIIAGIYPKKSDSPEWPVNLLTSTPFQQAEQDGALEVDGAPTGFMRIRRCVLEALATKAPKFTGSKHKPGDDPIALIFERTLEPRLAGKPRPRRLSGDYAFCEKAKARGYRIFIDPEMRFTHAGTKVWDGCLGDFLRDKAGLDHPRFAQAIESIRSDGTNNAAFYSLYFLAGNHFAATPDMLFTAYQMALRTSGNVLEAGSGLTTLVMGLAAEKSGATVYSLEHDIEWHDKVGRWLRKYGIRTVRHVYSPLEDIDGCRWYGRLPTVRKYDLVVMDGPPRRFGREGLFIRLGRETAGAAIIADDVNDPSQMELLHKHCGGRPVHTFDVSQDKARQFGVVAAETKLVLPQPMRAFA